MVLRGPLRGRVGRRRTQFTTRVVRFAEQPSLHLCVGKAGSSTCQLTRVDTAQLHGHPERVVRARADRPAPAAARHRIRADPLGRRLRVGPGSPERVAPPSVAQLAAPPRPARGRRTTGPAVVRVGPVPTSPDHAPADPVVRPTTAGAATTAVGARPRVRPSRSVAAAAQGPARVTLPAREESVPVRPDHARTPAAATVRPLARAIAPGRGPAALRSAVAPPARPAREITPIAAVRVTAAPSPWTPTFRQCRRTPT